MKPLLVLLALIPACVTLGTPMLFAPPVAMRSPPPKPVAGDKPVTSISAVYFNYDLRQRAQVEIIAKLRHAAKISPLIVVENPASGPGYTPAEVAGWDWTVENAIVAGYVDLDDDDGRPRDETLVAKDVATWAGRGVALVLLDDAHWRGNAKADAATKARVLAALKLAKWPASKTLLNPGGPLPEGAWMQSGGFRAFTFEDPPAQLSKASTGGGWIGFVANDADAQKFVETARARGVSMMGFDDLKNWHVDKREFQRPLSPFIKTLLARLQ